MFAPYGRLVVLHVTIIVGAVAICVTGAPAAAIVVLVLLKIALDLGLHLAEHREAETATAVARDRSWRRAMTIAPRPVERVVRDPRFERLVPADAELVRLADGALWAEGPVYVPDDDAVLWSDVRRNVVHRWSDGRRRRPTSTARPTSPTATRSTTTGGSSPASTGRGASRATRPTARGRPWSIAIEGRRLNSPNDLVVASDGAIWFTDPPYGILDDREGYKADSELGALLRLPLRSRRRGELTIVDRRPDPPERPGLLARRARRCTCRTPRSRGSRAATTTSSRSTSSTGGARVARGSSRVIEPGLSDGFRVDVEGNLWTSAGDGIHVLDARGVELGRILLPEDGRATARSAAPTAGGCSSPRPRPCGRSRSGSAARSTPWVDGG